MCAPWRAHSMHPRGIRRHFRGAQRHPTGRLMELPRSYVMPSQGDSWPPCHSIRSARRSTVLRGSGPATLSLTGRERCRREYVLYALSRLLGESDRVGRGGGPMGLIPLFAHSPTPPFPFLIDYPVVPLAPSMNTRSYIPDGLSKQAKGKKVSTRQTKKQARVRSRHTTESQSRPPQRKCPGMLASVRLRPTNAARRKL